MSRVLRFVLIGTALTGGVFAPVATGRAIVQEATPAADCPATTTEENEELVRRWFTALSEGTGEDFAVLAAADIVYHDPSPQEEAQTGGAGEWASERQADYPDLQVTVEHLVGEGDMVASYQRHVGTQEGDIEDDLGLPATGASTEWVSMGLFRIDCGKIAEIWSVADDLGRLQRLGVITDEELQSVAPVSTPTG